MATPPPPTANDAPFPFRTWLGVMLLFIFFGLLVIVLVRIVPRGDTYEAKRAEARVAKLKTTMEEAHKELTTYTWVDKNKGVTRIPIDRALELTVADLAQKKPEPAGPIETPAPSPGSSAAPGTSPQPPASPAPQGNAKPKLPSVEGPKNPESRGQPAAAANPPNAQPGTQPGANVAPVAAPPPVSSPAPTASPQTPAASPSPAAGKTPTPTP